MKKYLYLTFITLLILILTACTETSSTPEKVADIDEYANETNSVSKENNDEIQGEAANSDENTAEPNVENKEFSVGEKIQLGKNLVTVTKVEKSTGDDFDQPKDGNEYVLVYVEIENAGEENIAYNPFDFQIKNSQGQISDQAFTIVNSDTMLESGELAPGGKVSGSIPFEQPKADTGLRLIYQPNFFVDSEQIVINLQ